MPELSSVNNLIIANGTYTLPITPGKYYTFGAAGTWDSGSLAVNWVDSAGNSVALPDSPVTANGGFVFCAPATSLSLVMTDVVTACSINISIATSV
jgi:hypothetical protein